MTTTAIATHTVGIEPITDDTRPHVPAGATRAVVERYDGRLVKVVITDADHTHATLDEYARSAAHIYGATYVRTVCPVAGVLARTARHVAQPINASLREALRTVTRDPQLARAAVEQLANTLGLHPRDLPLWDVTRTRSDVAAVLNIAARRTR